MTQEPNHVADIMSDRLWLKVLIGLGLGVLVGFILGPDLNLVKDREFAETIGNWLALPGNLFLTLIRFVIIPLVISSVAIGIAGGNDADAIRKIGVSVIVYFLITTTVAVSIGVGLTQLIQPGSWIDPAMTENLVTDITIPGTGADATIPDTIVSLIPTNPFASMAEGALLQIVIASAIFGIALLMIPDKESGPLISLLSSVQSASMAIVRWLMLFAPIAVFGLLANITIMVGLSAIVALSAYVATFLAVLACMLAFYALILVFVVRRSPLEFFRKIREPFLIGFSTSSSSATMPVTLSTAENELNIHPTVARLVVPLGATINMDGTAAYQAVVAVFIAQVFGIDLSTGDIMTILALSIGASIGTPGMPGAGVPILMSILIAIGIPAEGIAIILSVDRILDMCRTSVNITGDLVTTCVMERITGLKAEPRVVPPQPAEG